MCQCHEWMDVIWSNCYDQTISKSSSLVYQHWNECVYRKWWTLLLYSYALMALFSQIVCKSLRRVYLNKRPLKCNACASTSVCISLGLNRFAYATSQSSRFGRVEWNSLNYSSEKKKQTHIIRIQWMFFLGCSIRHDRSYSSSLMLLIFFLSNSLSFPIRSRCSFSHICFAFNKHIVRLNVVNDASIQFHSFEAEHFMLHIHSTPRQQSSTGKTQVKREQQQQQNRLRYFISWLCV